MLCQWITPVNGTEPVSASVTRLTPDDWRSLLILADRYLVTPSLYLGLRQQGLLVELETDIKEQLEAIYFLNGDRNSRLRVEALTAIKLLNTKSIEPVMLKGVAGLLTGLYDHEGERVIGDIDLLVRKSELTKALSVLTLNGYHCDHPTLAAVSDQSFYKRELTLISNTGIAVIDLHIRPGCPGASAFVSSESARENAVRVSLEDATALLPSLEFRLMHNFYHAQSLDYCYLNGSINLRQLLDWVRLWQVANPDTAYRDIEKKLVRHRLRNSFALYMLNANRFLKQPIHPAVNINFLTECLFQRQIGCLQYGWIYKLNELITFILRAFLAFSPERLRLGFGDIPASKLLKLFIHNFLTPAWHKRRLDDVMRVFSIILAKHK